MSSAPYYAVTTPNTNRGLDAAVWQLALSDYVSNNPLYGTRFSDDFVETLVGLTGTVAATIDRKWTVRDAAAAGGTYAFANSVLVDGVGELSSTGTTNHFGVEAQGAGFFALPTHTTTPRGRLCFQARVDFDTADTVFVGLAENQANFLSATSALPTDSDYVGFYTDDNGATLSFVCANDNAGGTAVTDTFTIPAGDISAAGTYNNLAFSVDIDSNVIISVNGNVYAKLQAEIDPLALPIESLAVRLAATAGGGTTAPEINIDRVDVFSANTTD
jgi:hypothetical protein